MMARRTALAGALLVVVRLSTRLVDLATVVVLARLLSPADFGLVAIGISIVTVIESALDLPLNQALLRLDRIERPHYDTAFTVAAARCALLYALLLVALWPLALWYGDPRLKLLVVILGLGALARGLISPRLAEFQKAMSFWRDMSIELSGKVVGATVGIATAWATHSYWAVAAGAIAFPIATLVASYGLAPYRPRFSLAHLPLFSGFLGWMSLAQIISTLNWQMERLLLGRVMTVARVGLFTTASDLSHIPMLAFFGPIMRPLLAAFNAVKDDRARLARSYLTASSGIMTLGVPLLVGESLLAEPIVHIVLGDRWLGIIPVLRWLAPSVIPGLFVMAAIPLVTAFGQMRDFAFRNAIEILVKLPVLWFGYAALGLNGVALARFVSEAVATVFCMRVVRRSIGLSMARQLSTAVPTLAATGAMVPAVILFRASVMQGAGPLDARIDLASSAAVGAAAYGCALYAVWRLAGRPEGVESLALDALGRLARRAPRPIPSRRGGTGLADLPTSPVLPSGSARSP